MTLHKVHLLIFILTQLRYWGRSQTGNAGQYCLR